MRLFVAFIAMLLMAQPALACGMDGMFGAHRFNPFLNMGTGSGSSDDYSADLSDSQEEYSDRSDDSDSENDDQASADDNPDDLSRS